MNEGDSGRAGARNHGTEAAQGHSGQLSYMANARGLTYGKSVACEEARKATEGFADQPTASEAYYARCTIRQFGNSV